MVERRPDKTEVHGSIPYAPTKLAHNFWMSKECLIRGNLDFDAAAKPGGWRNMRGQDHPGAILVRALGTISCDDSKCPLRGQMANGTRVIEKINFANSGAAAEISADGSYIGDGWARDFDVQLQEWRAGCEIAIRNGN